MRIFVYGMQSSGASLAAFLIGQVPESVVLVDLYSYAVMPAIEAPGARHVVAKAVITTTHRLDEHLRNYAPDVRILVLRDPVQNYVSLGRKEYANDDGSLDDKFRRLDETFRHREVFDLVLRYEDVVSSPARVAEMLKSVGIPFNEDMYGFPRNKEEILEYNFAHCEWCRERYGRGWSFGNIRGDGMKQTLVYKVAPSSVHDSVRELCPSLYRYYEQGSAGTLSIVSRGLAIVEDLIIRRVRKLVRLSLASVRKLASVLQRAFRD